MQAHKGGAGRLTRQRMTPSPVILGHSIQTLDDMPSTNMEPRLVGLFLTEVWINNCFLSILQVSK